VRWKTELSFLAAVPASYVADFTFNTDFAHVEDASVSST
jgi:hypothetical protein